MNSMIYHYGVRVTFVHFSPMCSSEDIRPQKILPSGRGIKQSLGPISGHMKTSVLIIANMRSSPLMRNFPSRK